MLVLLQGYGVTDTSSAPRCASLRLINLVRQFDTTPDGVPPLHRQCRALLPHILHLLRPHAMILSGLSRTHEVSPCDRSNRAIFLHDDEETAVSFLTSLQQSCSN